MKLYKIWGIRVTKNAQCAWGEQENLVMIVYNASKGIRTTNNDDQQCMHFKRLWINNSPKWLAKPGLIILCSTQEHREVNSKQLCRTWWQMNVLKSDNTKQPYVYKPRYTKRLTEMKSDPNRYSVNHAGLERGSAKRSPYTPRVSPLNGGFVRGDKGVEIKLAYLCVTD